MNDSTLTTPVTMRTFLFDVGDGMDTSQALERAISENGATAKVLSGVRRLSAATFEAVDRQIAAVVGDLLELDFGDVLIACWRTRRSLLEAAERTLAAPGSRELVDLAKHRGRVTYEPHVDLLLNGVRLHTFEFTVAVGLETISLAAVLNRGALVEMQGGRCVATATLTLDGAQVRRKEHRFDPALILSLSPGVPIASAASEVSPRRRLREPIARARARVHWGRQQHA